MPAGRFLPGSSIIHRLDARAKLISFLILIAAAVSASTIWGYALAFLVTAAIAALSKLPPRTVLDSVRWLGTFFAFIFLMNALFSGGSSPLFSFWIFAVSAEGIAQGINAVLRFMLVIVLGGIFTCTTSPRDITGAIEALMKPLKLIRVPVEDVAMILGIAVQFIPTLIEETDIIKKAQIARGAHFESRRLGERALSFASLAVPIFLSAFRRADELSVAMEARGYKGAGNRTKARGEPLRRFDFAALLLSAAVCLVQLCLLR